MERLPTTPHDAVFRQMLMQKEVARDFLAVSYTHLRAHETH